MMHQVGSYTTGTAIERSAPAPQPQPSGHIPDSMGELDKLTMTLVDELSMLEQRISAVLRPVPPSVNGPSDANTPKPTRSGLADSLTDINARLYMQVQRVRELAARADL